MKLQLLCAVVAALVVAPAGASARDLTVQLPSTISADRAFTVTWQGDTGPRDPTVFGGFVVKVLFQGANGRCPADPSRGFAANPRVVALGDQSVLNPTPFRGANRVSVPRAGRYRLCGYVTRPTARISYELLVQRANVRVRPEPSRGRLVVPRAASGTYVAAASRTTGGGPTATVRFTIRNRRVVSLAATSLRLTRCDVEAFPSTPALNTLIDVTSRGPATGLGSSIARSSIATSLPAALPEATIQLHGGFSSSREIRGVVTGTSADGVCQGSFAFIARR